MPDASRLDVTRLLVAWGNGDTSAADQLLPLVYDELHKVAARAMRRENEGHTLQPTELINEVYLRLGVSPATVKREWAVARAWLRRESTSA